jgi:hypothetical protein
MTSWRTTFWTKLLVMNVDADVFQWFKSQGPEYKNLLNTVLRLYARSTKVKSDNQQPALFPFHRRRK